ncbi:MAG: hypothetical protein ACLQFR_17235 [Streptosporangiaceae bacterium]
MISRPGRLLAETGKATPQAILEKASQPGRQSPGPLARALEDFFADSGLAFAADHYARRQAERRRRQIEQPPEPLRPAVDRWAAAMTTTAQHGAWQAGTRPRSDRTITDELSVLRDLALFLITERGKTDWATFQADDLEAFLALRPASRGRRLTILRSSFGWARASHVTLASPAGRLPAARHRGYHCRTLPVAEQRRLFCRWTSGDPAVRPHEALAGLLALLHATPSRELRHLEVSDIDAAARTLRLGCRPHPVPWTRPPGRRCSAAWTIANSSAPATLTSSSRHTQRHGAPRPRTDTWSGSWTRPA